MEVECLLTRRGAFTCNSVTWWTMPIVAIQPWKEGGVFYCGFGTLRLSSAWALTKYSESVSVWNQGCCRKNIVVLEVFAIDVKSWLCSLLYLAIHHEFQFIMGENSVIRYRPTCTPWFALHCIRIKMKADHILVLANLRQSWFVVVCWSRLQDGARSPASSYFLCMRS